MDNNYFEAVWEKIKTYLDSEAFKLDEEFENIPPPENNPDFKNCPLKQFNIDAPL